VPESSTEFAVIALVASVGGLDAVSRILGALPDALDASVIVLIHQSPDRANALVELLGRRSKLPVLEAEHGMPLRSGTVVVAPPGKHLLVTPDATVALIVSGAAPPSRPSADLLLSTLAISVGRRATAVVLSGGGHDGATGASVIHEFGGTVIATDEASSSAFSMPQATIERDGVIDHIVALDEVADLLASIVSGARL